MKHRTLLIIALCILTSLLLSLAPDLSLVSAENIARGKSYTYNQTPTYSYTADFGDARQLTDGIYSQWNFWTQKSTVGWVTSRPVIITVDLGAIMPISGFSFDTAAGRAGVTWPLAIHAVVSDDGKTYYEASELVRASADAHRMPADGYAIFRYQAKGLATHGRYVTFVVFPSGPYTFCDEVEVYRGNDADLASPLPEESISDLDRYLPLTVTRDGIARRLCLDCEALRQEIATSALSKSDREGLLDELKAIEKEHPEKDVDFATFSTEFPQNEAHANLFRLQAKLWRMSGMPSVALWQTGLWDYLKPIAAPNQLGKTELDVTMMRNEYRAASFNLSNSSDHPVLMNMSVVGMPGGAVPEYIEFNRVAWTDTKTGIPVASALMPLKAQNGTYKITLQPGLTQQVWLTFHPARLAGGNYKGKIEIHGAGTMLEASLSLELSPMVFPDHPHLHLGGWDYTHTDRYNAVTPENRDAIIEILKEHYVDSPWATTEVMPTGKYDAMGTLVENPDTAKFDTWLSRWPDAARYCVASWYGKSFAGSAIGDALFAKKVSAWASFWAKYLTDKGIAPNRLCFLAIDEPHVVEQDATVIAWAKAIKESGSGLTVWEDPTWPDPNMTNNQLYELSDIICFNRQLWAWNKKEYESFNNAQGSKKRTIELYECYLTSLIADPCNYFLLQAWECWRIGSGGMHFWSFGDSGGGSVWNAYSIFGTYFSPLCIDSKSAYSTKQMEAIREGVEDYEYLVMLDVRRNWLGSIESTDASSLQEVLEAVTSFISRLPGPEEYKWNNTSAYNTDALRLRILRFLEPTP